MGLLREATASTLASVTNNRYLGLRFHCSESREEEVRLSWGASQNPNNVVREGHRCRMPALLCPSYDLLQAGRQGRPARSDRRNWGVRVKHEHTLVCSEQ